MKSAAPSSLRWCLRVAVVTVLSTSACTVLLGSDDSGLVDDGTNCYAGWTDPEPLDIPVLGVVVQINGRADEFQALTDEGRLLEYEDVSSVSHQIGELGVTADLRALARVGSDVRVAVGDAGQIWRGVDGASEWVPVDAGTSDDFHSLAAASDGAWVLAIATERVLLSSDQGQTWAELEAPAQSWSGQLRRGFVANGVAWLVGDNGQAWSSPDPAGAWTTLELPTTDDLIGGGEVPGCSACVALISDSRILARAEDGEWTEISEGFSKPLLAYDYGRIASDDGTILELGEPGPWPLAELTTVEFVPTVLGGGDDEVQIAGVDGELQRIFYQDDCE